MTRSSGRILAPITLMAGVVLACAHGGANEQRGPTPEPSRLAPTEISEARQSATTLDQMLAGRISGVSVTRAPGGGVSVLIRGPSSFFLNEEPLYVVDGVTFTPGPNGTLRWIRPEDIESIAVLRDAAAAIYGVRGGNGVILIRTKGSH
jgi:TonB-dependent starch-binding outer membrane protein SusC